MKLTKEQIKNRRQWANALQVSVKTTGVLCRNSDTTPSYCCLGVYAHEVCGIPNNALRGPFLCALGNEYLPMLVDVDVGLDIEGEDTFAKLNDFKHMSHADIGLYLYFTCEAGEAFEFNEEEYDYTVSHFIKQNTESS